MDKERKINAALAAIPLLLLPVGLWFVGFYRENISIHVPPCPARLCYQIYCPGCGGSHCIYDITQGRFLTALRDNAMVCAGLLWVLLFWMQNVFRALGKKIRLVPASRGFYLAAAGTALVYCVLRNFIPALAPVSLWF